MIRTFLVERISWIGLLVLLQGLALLLTYLDPAIPMTAVLYYVFLSSFICSVFLIVRYQQETRFYHKLKNRDSDFDLTSVPEANRPFEAIVEEAMTEQIERLKQEGSENQMLLEQEKDEMLSWIHEVKTPMTAIHLIMDRMEDQKLKAQLTYEWLRIHLLLDQQLHQKRMPFIENDLYLEQTDLESLVFTEIKTLQSWCVQKGLGFDVDLNVTSVLSDAKWLAFMIRQLLTNSVKYSENAEIYIRSFEKDRQIIFEIEDEGQGIDEKDIPRIFNKGFTSTTQHQDHAATGMGLYLTKKIARSLHIHIDVQSIRNEGTTFTLSFPKKNEFEAIRGM
ncbi:sensor histidine kinase [Salibacterium lacus]|uniref:histidine kinase n=1 Tax=Salibacterium lacus TaxID=1898109 RepID=A0ABW5T449_9BACI